MIENLNLDSSSSLSDNITRIRMKGASLSSPDVLEELIAVTRKNGFSVWELEDARKIQANLASRSDPAAIALHGLAEQILEGYDSQDIRKRGLVDIQERRDNKLPSLSWHEQMPLTEQKKREQTANILALQNKLLRSPKLQGRRDRVFHQKLVLARMCHLTVRDSLPAYAKIGPFSQPGVFRAAIRFSNGQGVPFADRDADVRGVAIKFFSKAGEETDILMTNSPASFARDADQFLKVAEVLVEQQLAGGGLKGLVTAAGEAIHGLFDERHFRFSEATRIARALAEQTVGNQPASLATQQFWGSVVRLGDYAVKMTLVPDNAAPKETKASKDDENYLRTDFESRITDTGVKYTLRLLFFTDEDKTSLNDASKAWDESPVQVDVADIEIVASQPDPQVTEDDINKMPFNPAHGFEGLGITRAREAIYRASATGRGASRREEYQNFFGVNG